ncbi:phosphosulfolactate synthase [Shimazuella kribbensis]|uniref:phosphosulfolactate synthase n=1 Tax=Shimazuella kribbensis TaxID=139808 RepID=UPI0003FE1C4A|nr:phosphosulfolactate synthase [Shimazuella kribbensis]
MEWTISERFVKPRANGVTMVMDKGLGIQAFEDLLSLAAPYIDFIKLGFGTLALTPEKIASKKIALAKKYNVAIYPGGTFFEIAYLEKKVNPYFQWLQQFGFEWIEISNGVVDYLPDERNLLIRDAIDKKFQVITEIGKKQAGSKTEQHMLIDQFTADRKAGASFVIIEGRETGEDIGIYNKQGEVDITYVKEVLRTIDNSKCIWETPKKGQQVKMIELCGTDVNLGNIAPADILSVESLRQGLRADTLLQKRNPS